MLGQGVMDKKYFFSGLLLLTVLGLGFYYRRGIDDDVVQRP